MTMKSIADQEKRESERPQSLRVRRTLWSTSSRSCCPVKLWKRAEGSVPEEITGPGGLLSQLAGRVIETALGAELTDHLGYPPAGRKPARPSTSATAARPRRSRPSWGRSRSRPRAIGRGASSRGLSASARPGRVGRQDPRPLCRWHVGPRHRIASGRALRHHGDRARHDQPRHRRRPGGRRRVAHPAAGRVYAIAYFDALMVKVRGDRWSPHPGLLPRDRRQVEGEREVLGLWWQETEGAKFWLAVLNDPPARRRGRPDRLRDGLTGFPEAIECWLWRSGQPSSLPRWHSSGS